MQTEQWKRIDSPEINPHNHSQMILDKEAKTIPQEKKDNIFNKQLWEN